MISCKTCEHYEEYLKDEYVMKCGLENSRYTSTDSEGCIDHTKLDEYANEEQPKHQAIACTKCGHTMRIEG